MLRDVIVVCVLLTGCAKKADSNEQPPPAPDSPESPSPPPTDTPEVDPTPPRRAEPFTEPERTHIVLERHTMDAPTASYLTVPIEGNDEDARVDLAALDNPRQRGTFRTIAAHGGQRHFVAPRQVGGAWILARMSTPEPSSPQEVSLPAAPDSLHVVGEHAYIGIHNTLHHVDFAEASPKLRTIHHNEGVNKPYDLFLRDRDWLFAIDDFVRPVVGDTIVLHADGEPTHQLGFSLPPLINGHYVDGALAAESKDAGTLFLLATYRRSSGGGKLLVALPVAQGRPVFRRKLVLNGSRSEDDPPVLEEHTPHQQSVASTSITDARATPWTGIALVRDGTATERVLLAAGTRGLLSLPVPFSPDTKAEVIDVQGPVADVLVHGDRVLVLTDEALVTLTWGEAEASETSRRKLDTHYHRIVD